MVGIEPEEEVVAMDDAIVKFRSWVVGPPFGGRLDTISVQVQGRGVAPARATGGPPNAKLHEMQQNTHGFMHLIKAPTPDDESISPTQGATYFVDCLACTVRLSREGVENGHGWTQKNARCVPGALTHQMAYVSSVCPFQPCP